MTVVKRRMDDDPAWLRAAWDDLGLKEIPGKKDNPRVVQMFAEAGFPQVDNDETAWCAAAIGSWLKRGGLQGTKSLMARSYLNWGETTSHPKRGDLAIFSRGKGWQGHVALYIGEDKTRIYHIGGNQSDGVTVTSSPRTKLLGYRTPITKKKMEAVTPESALKYVEKAELPNPPKTKEQRAMVMLMHLGWGRYVAASLIGNAIVESNLDTNGSGIMRWNEKRREQLATFSANNPTLTNPLELQINFIDWELRNTNKDVFNRFRKANSMEECLRIAIAYVNPVGYNPKKPESGDRWIERLKASYALL